MDPMRFLDVTRTALYCLVILSIAIAGGYLSLPGVLLFVLGGLLGFGIAVVDVWMQLIRSGFSADDAAHLLTGKK